MMAPSAFGILLFVGWIGAVCNGSPTNTVVVQPVAVGDGSDSTKRESGKPRCLMSLLGLDSYEPPTMPDFGSPSFQGGIPGYGLGGSVGGLQGGILSGNNNGFGLGSGSFGGTSSGLGLPSQFTPGLGQASDVYKHSQGLESQLYGSQALLNSQLGGVPNSGIPLSPGFLRGSGVSAVRSLPPPPTLIYSR